MQKTLESKHGITLIKIWDIDDITKTPTNIRFETTNPHNGQSKSHNSEGVARSFFKEYIDLIEQKIADKNEVKQNNEPSGGGMTP